MNMSLSLSLMFVQVVEEAFAPSAFGIWILLLLSNTILKNSSQYFGKSCLSSMMINYHFIHLHYHPTKFSFSLWNVDLPNIDHWQYHWHPSKFPWTLQYSLWITLLSDALTDKEPNCFIITTMTHITPRFLVSHLFLFLLLRWWFNPR